MNKLVDIDSQTKAFCVFGVLYLFMKIYDDYYYELKIFVGLYE